MTQSAAVIGAGIGGLAAALGLQQQGWDVTVYERATQPATTGTGFGIWPEALRALAKLGVADALRREALPQRDGTFRRPDGRVFATLDVERLRHRAGEGVRLVSRPALLRLLHSELAPGTVRFDTPVVDIQRLAADHRVVVAADGMSSTTRTALFGSRYAPRYSGSTVWRGVAPLTTDQGSETWGRAAKFGITPLGEGRTNWYAVLTVPEGYRPPAGDAAELRRRFGDWHRPIPAILECFEDSDVLHHDLYYLDPPLPAYVRGNVALLGDAAHAMTPDLGQGACQALIDGVVLTRCLASAGPEQALAEYDDRRRRRTQRLAKLALRASRMAQVSRFTGLRNLALRAMLLAGPPA